MATWFDTIEIFDEIAFDDGPLETPTTWYDISDSVLSFRSFVGKTSLDTEFAPGYASLRLDNSEGHFTPQNTLGDYYPNVKPMRRFRRRVMVEATEYVVFTGYVLSWDQDWRARTSYVDVPLVDGSRLVENTPLPTSAYADEIANDSPFAYYPFQNGNQAIDVVGGFDGTLTPSPTAPDTSVDSVDQSTPISEPGSVNASTDGLIDFRRSTSTAFEPVAVDFWVRPVAGSPSVIAYRTSTDSDGLQVIINGTDWRAEYRNTAANKYLSSTGNFVPGLDVWCHVAVSVSSTEASYYINGKLITTQSVSTGAVDPFTIISGVDGFRFLFDIAISHVAFYESTLSASRVAAHYEAGRTAWAGPGYSEFGGTRITRVLDDAGFPAGLRDLDDGQTIHGPYLPAGLGLLDYLRQIERAEQGLLYFGGDGSVTFRDRATLSGGVGTVIFSDDEDDIEAGAVEYTSGNPRGNPIDWIRNIVTASYASTGGITRRSSASVTDYGEARQVLDTPTLPDGRAASNLAAYVVRERKDPKSLFPALTVEMRPNTIDKMHELFGLEIGSVVTVRRTPFDLPYEVEETGIVLGMEHDNPGDSGQWYMTLYLAPAPVQYNDADTPLLRVGSGDDTNKIGAAAGNIIIA